MKLSQFYDSDHMFGRLIYVDSGYFFVIFSIDFFKKIYHLKLDWMKLGLVICFYLLHTRLSKSHNSDCESNILTWIDSIYYYLII